MNTFLAIIGFVGVFVVSHFIFELLNGWVERVLNRWSNILLDISDAFYRLRNGRGTADNS